MQIKNTNITKNIVQPLTTITISFIFRLGLKYFVKFNSNIMKDPPTADPLLLGLNINFEIFLLSNSSYVAPKILKKMNC